MKSSIDNIDLKYINKSVVLFKIGSFIVPAYSLIWFILWMVFQSLFFFFICLFLIGISIYLESNNFSFKIFIDLINYIKQNYL